MKKVAIYVRVSTRDKGQDINNQVNQLQEYCKNKQWQIFEIYQDHETGQKGRKERTNFDRLFKDARMHRFNVVLFWALDRFSREGLYDTLRYLKELDSYGVKFISYIEEYLNTENELIADILLALIAIIAKYESKKISERTKAGLERSKKEFEARGEKMPTRSLSDNPDRRDLQILEELKDNKTPYRIAKEMKISITTVKKYRDQFIKDGIL